MFDLKEMISTTVSEGFQKLEMGFAQKVAKENRAELARYGDGFKFFPEIVQIMQQMGVELFSFIIIKSH